MPGLADGLGGDGSIQTLDAAAPWRLADAKALEPAGRGTAAVYLYGYAAEIRITASLLQDQRICTRADDPAIRTR